MVRKLGIGVCFVHIERERAENEAENTPLNTGLGFVMHADVDGRLKRFARMGVRRAEAG